jgi:hypothetical protein
MRQNKNLLSLILAVAVLALTPAVASAQNYYETLEYEVAEDGLRFSFDEAPLLDNGFPAYGNPFVTIGYMYPKNTLSVDSSGTVNGVNADGSPQFPTKVKGTWHCRGWFIGEGAATTTGPWDITHQLYEINGRGSITTDGTELADIEVWGSRSVTGGTGYYKRVSGEQSQAIIGFNQTGGVGLRIKFNIFR